MAITVLSGSEPFLKEEALCRLKNTALGGYSQDLSYDTFCGGGAAEDLKAALRTADFFTHNKLVVVKNINRLSELQKQALLEYVKNPSPKTHLVLDINHKDLLNGFLSGVTRHAKVIKCDRLLGRNIYSWVYSRLHDYKKRISKEAVDLLVESAGDDLRTLASELDKLTTYVGARVQITKRDVELLVGGGLSCDVFDLVDAIARGDRARSLELVSLLAGNRKKEAEIIGLIGWQFKRLWKATQLRHEGKTSSEIGRALRVPDRFLSKFIDQLNNFDIEGIKKRIKILLEADRDLKTGKKKRRLALELLAVRLCSA